MAVGAAVVAAIGTAYAIYSSERAHSEQQKAEREERRRYQASQEEQRRQTAEEQARYEEAQSKFEEALARSREAYQVDVGKAKKWTDYWRGIAEDPTGKAPEWGGWESQVEKSFQQAMTSVQAGAARRGGLRGGMPTEALRGLETAKSEKLADTLSYLVKEAKAKEAAVPTPRFQEPPFQGVGTPPPVYNPLYFQPISPLAAPQLDLSGFGAFAGSESGEAMDKRIWAWLMSLGGEGGATGQREI